MVQEIWPYPEGLLTPLALAASAAGVPDPMLKGIFRERC